MFVLGGFSEVDVGWLAGNLVPVFLMLVLVIGELLPVVKVGGCRSFTGFVLEAAFVLGMKFSPSLSVESVVLWVLNEVTEGLNRWLAEVGGWKSSVFGDSK